MLDHLKFFQIINVLAYKKNVNPLLSTTLSGGSFFASPNSTPNFCHTLLSYLSYDKFLAPPHHLINFQIIHFEAIKNGPVNSRYSHGLMITKCI